MRRLAVRLRPRARRPATPSAGCASRASSLDRLVQQGVGGRRGLDPDGDRSLLRNGPVHYALTPLPGAGEPFAVAGHRTTYGAPFYELDKLREGDPIYVDTPYAKFRYAVAKTTTVDPTDISVLSDRGYGLVLTTCTPPYSAAHRLIVWATLEKAKPLQKARGRLTAAARLRRLSPPRPPGNGGRSDDVPPSSMTSSSVADLAAGVLGRHEEQPLRAGHRAQDP